MPSCIPGYEYDIFISYRQNDNRSGWVTEFVKNLQEELASTIKESVSIYLDSNTDGLRDHDDVDESLRQKIKVLILIPVLSQTYCDPNSFAFRHELIAFRHLAETDDFGLKVKLANGNVCSRILPVRIHEPDPEDIKLFETESRGVLRPIDFIFRSMGVNRPLRPSDDARNDIAGHLFYRDQMNKLANSIKEILVAIQTGKKHFHENDRTPPHAHEELVNRLLRKRQKLLSGLALALLVAAACIVYSLDYFERHVEPDMIDTSIAVIPFVDMSPDHDQGYLSDGITEEILNHLYKIGDLKVISRTSAMQFRDSKLLIPEIAAKLGVAHILEGSVQRQGNRVRIRIQLINGKSDEHLWAETYEREMKDVFAIQTDIATQVASMLKVKINKDVERRMQVLPTKSTQAYDLFLKARREQIGEERATLLRSAIAMDSAFALAYAELALNWIYRGGHAGDKTAAEVERNVTPLLEKALALDPDLAPAHFANGLLNLYYRWNFDVVEEEYKKIVELRPSDHEARAWFSDYLIAAGKIDEALRVTQNHLSIDRNTFHTWVQVALAKFYGGDGDGALQLIRNGLDNTALNYPLNYIRMLVYTKHYGDALSAFEKYYPDCNNSSPLDRDACPPLLVSYAAIAGFKAGDTKKAQIMLDALATHAKRTPVGSPSFCTASVYAELNEYDLMMEFLERSYRNREVEFYWIKIEPMFRPYHGDVRFRALVSKIWRSS